jgi:hypothetical protein
MRLYKLPRTKVTRFVTGVCRHMRNNKTLGLQMNKKLFLCLSLVHVIAVHSKEDLLHTFVIKNQTDKEYTLRILPKFETLVDANMTQSFSVPQKLSIFSVIISRARPDLISYLLNRYNSLKSEQGRCFRSGLGVSWSFPTHSKITLITITKKSDHTIDLTFENCSPIEN